MVNLGTMEMLFVIGCGGYLMFAAIFIGGLIYRLFTKGE